MKTALKKRAALLAASSMLAASASFGAAASVSALSTDPSASAVVIEVPLEPASPAASEEAEQSSSPAGKWALAALAAGGLAWLLKVFGVRKAADSVVRVADSAARGAATATGAVVKAAGRAVRSPLRWAAGAFALGLFVLTGVGLYDIEWIAGLAVGAGLALVGAAGVRKLRRKWLPGVMGNGN